ncbi:interleukin-20 receptor subunit beta [Salminus brasiliensis]|uniref:interleukin-20 receptor subunit beta n=1 Tax=Salminus brasiliensis TaxID=930266 RepID=UPI003B831A8E
MVQTRGLIVGQTLLLLSITLNCASLLPTPQNLSIQSVNMRHLLRWSPPQVACGAVHYSVKFQGEYETHMLNGSWVDAYDCQEIVQTQCDLTLDLGSDSDYSIGVQAQCSGQTSWAQLPSSFNRRDTVLVAPNMSVTATGSLIHVVFSEVLPQITINLRVWRPGDEQSASSQVITARPYQFSFDTQQNGGTHCVKAEALLESINKSSSTETNCISVPGFQSHWHKPVTVSAAVVITVAIALAFGWRLPRCGPRLRQAMCAKEPLPNALLEDWPASTPTFSSSVLLEPTDSVTLLHLLEAQDGVSGKKAPCAETLSPAQGTLSPGSVEQNLIVLSNS